MINSLLAIMALLLVSASHIHALGSNSDFFAKDPAAIYDDRYPNREVIIEIPGYKLDEKSALEIAIGEDEY